jgi:hypothetical protein
LFKWTFKPFWGEKHTKQTQVVEVSTDEGVLFPIGGIRMVVRVMYQYTSGTP